MRDRRDSPRPGLLGVDLDSGTGLAAALCPPAAGPQTLHKGMQWSTVRLGHGASRVTPAEAVGSQCCRCPSRHVCSGRRAGPRPSGFRSCASAGASGRATEKSRSGQDRGQQGGVAPDLVPQQSDGQIRSEILLNRAHQVQCGPSENAHHGGGVAPVPATVVLPERHVQDAAPAAPRHPRANRHCRSARRAAARGGRCVPCAPGSGCPGRAPRRGPPPLPRGRDRPGPCRCVARGGRRCAQVPQGSCTVGVKTPRAASSKAARTSACRVGWLRLDRPVVAAGGLERDDGPRQDPVLEPGGGGP